MRRTQQDASQGEVAVVTGGSRGLGFLIARELGRSGCQVAICARNTQELAARDLSTRGMEVAQRIDPTLRPWLERVMILGQQAAQRYNQYGGEKK